MRAPEWMTNEMARLTSRLERYKPAGSGYNRIQSIRLSKSVMQMLNNPMPVASAANAANPTTVRTHQQESSFATPHRRRGVLSRSESQWEEVYPVVNISRQQSSESACSGDSELQFTHYRNCATRIP
ncbi:uncharacterized protein [Drosophila kikkawai]|uniref:Uncharacterized protein n=1 Tax=Drosophila kikkawai TaxID=30033 RepID=A0A6P4I790_DROKI|nr:uncharacterized protein LOC108075908 [Drosophila kikkawai]